MGDVGITKPNNFFLVAFWALAPNRKILKKIDDLELIELTIQAEPRFTMNEPSSPLVCYLSQRRDDLG